MLGIVGGYGRSIYVILTTEADILNCSRDTSESCEYIQRYGSESQSSALGGKMFYNTSAMTGLDWLDDEDEILDFK